MKRAERRHRTESKKKTRNWEYERVMGFAPRNPGQGRIRSPFDCGKPGCKCGGSLGRLVPLKYTVMRPRKPGKREIRLEVRWHTKDGSSPTRWRRSYRSFRTIRDADNAVRQLNKPGYRVWKNYAEYRRTST